jgi:hypothetical protein
MRYDRQLIMVLQNAANATDNGVPLPCTAPNDGYETAVLQVTGTFSGTVTFEATLDGTNWIAVQGINLNSGAATSSTTSAGLFRFDIRGLFQLRARISAYTSGNITVRACAVG